MERVPGEVQACTDVSDDLCADVVEKVDIIQTSIITTANVEDTRIEDSVFQLKTATSSSSESNVIPCGAESKKLGNNVVEIEVFKLLVM